MVSVSGIYVIYNNQSGKMYIGSSKNILDRWRRHKYHLNKGIHDNIYLQRAWDKDGKESFEFQIVEYCDANVLHEREQVWIDSLNVLDKAIGYNLTMDTQRPGKGYKHSPETLAKMSKAQIGRKHSQETLRKMSENQKGKRWTEEAKLKASLKRKGRKVSEETRRKISISAKKISKEIRNNAGLKRSKKYIVTSPNGDIFEVIGLRSFCLKNNLSDSNMSAVASGRLKHHKGWKCYKV